MARKMSLRQKVVQAALAEFKQEYSEYIEMCAIRRADGNDPPDRSEIDFYFQAKIPGIDQAAREVEAELLGENAASAKAA